MMGVSEEELYNLPTAEYVNRRAFLNKQLTVYHVAFHACADLKSKEVLFCTLLQCSLNCSSHTRFVLELRSKSFLLYLFLYLFFLDFVCLHCFLWRNWKL